MDEGKNLSFKWRLSAKLEMECVKIYSIKKVQRTHRPGKLVCKQENVEKIETDKLVSMEK